MFQDFFGGLFDIVSTLLNLIITTITSLVQLIINIPTYITLLVSSVNVLPGFIIPFALAFISLIVIQYIIGKRTV